jgi:hypothetical protein
MYELKGLTRLGDGMIDSMKLRTLDGWKIAGIGA